MTLAELNDRARQLHAQIDQMNVAMDKIHDEQKLVAHSEQIVKLMADLEDVMTQIHKQN